MGQRSRKRRGAASAPPPPSLTKPPKADGNAAMRRGYARGEARNEAIRAELRPYAPGERPLVLVIASALALVVAVANVVLYLTGYEVREGEQPTLGGTLIFATIMLAAAAGMWLKRYWAVLGFQALLGLTIVYASFGLIQASNVRAALLTLAVIAVAGTLFWFLVKTMARIQMPERPAKD